MPLNPYQKRMQISYRSGFGSLQSGVTESGSTYSQSNPESYTNTVYNAQADGFFNPYWKSQVRNNQNATTVFTASRVSDDPAPWFAARLDSTTVDSFNARAIRHAEAFGYLNLALAPTLISAPSGTVTDVNNRCIRKFLVAAKSAQSSFEAGQDIGELKETIESMLHPMKSLRDGMVSYLETLRKRRSGSKKSKPALKKILSDTYLEYHFGWAPLAQDVADLIADFGRYRFPIIPISAYASEVFQGDAGTRDTGSGFLAEPLSQSYLTTSKYAVKIKGAVKSNSGMDGRISWAQSLQLTPENWLPTAWDLLPYSWIADYFVNIGDIFQGLSFVNSSLAWACRTFRTESKSKVSDFYFSSPPANPGFGRSYEFYARYIYGGSCESTNHSIVREPITGEDLMPTVQFRIPTSKYPFLNVGALLLQRSRPLIPFF